MKYAYGRIQLTGQAIEHSNSDKGAFIAALKLETDGMVNDVKRDYNRQHWGTGDGVIATCGVSTGTTVTLASTTSQVQMRQLEVGMVIDIATIAQAAAGTGGKVHGATISATDRVNKTITIGSSITVAATDFVFRAGNGGVVGTSQREVTGLQLIVDSTGTLFNVNPTTHPVWASTEDSTGGAISEDLILKNIQAVAVESGEDIDQIWVSIGLHRAVYNLLSAKQRFVNNRDYSGGWTGLEFAAPSSNGGGSVGVMSERDAPAGIAWGLTTKHLISYYSADWKWDNRMGTVLKNVSSQDAFEAWMFRYGEFATDQRNAHFKLTGLTDASS